MSTLGLNGDYSGTCLVCIAPTDTALGFRGEPEWCIAGIMALGVPQAQAEHMVKAGYSDAFDQLPDPLAVVIRVCAECVEDVQPKFPRPGLALPGHEVPGIYQPLTEAGEHR